MNRVLMIDRDAATMQRLGLACLGRGVAVAMAENLCEGVRVLLSTPVSLVVVDQELLHFTPSENATLFARVAEGVPVTVVVRPDTPVEARVALEVQGFRVLTRPVSLEDVLDKPGAGAGLTAG
jgi:DNA-binding response OmpR family regulator